MSRSQRRRERSQQLVKHKEGGVQDEQVVLDDEGYPVPTDGANVLFSLDAGTTSEQEGQLRSRWLRIFGFAPANSPLGRTLATIPLCILLSVVPFAMASAAALFVKITWVIAIALFVGLGAASAFGWLQIRRRRVAPVVAPAATHVITMSVPRVEPSQPATPLPEPEVP